MAAFSNAPTPIARVLRSSSARETLLLPPEPAPLTPAAIRKAYLKQSVLVHPDKHGGAPEAAEAFLRVHAAQLKLNGAGADEEHDNPFAEFAEAMREAMRRASEGEEVDPELEALAMESAELIAGLTKTGASLGEAIGGGIGAIAGALFRSATSADGGGARRTGGARANEADAGGAGDGGGDGGGCEGPGDADENRGRPDGAARDSEQLGREIGTVLGGTLFAVGGAFAALAIAAAHDHQTRQKQREERGASDAERDGAPGDAPSDDGPGSGSASR